MLNYRLYTDFLGRLWLSWLLLMSPAVGAAYLNTPASEVSVSDGTLFNNSINTAQTVDVSITMAVVPEDVGKKAAVFIVSYTDNKWYMQDSNGVWLVWNFPDMQALLPYRSDQVLAAENKLGIARQLSGFKGAGDIYAGYKVDGGDYRYNVEPVTFTSFRKQLNDTGAQSCANATQTRLTCPQSGFPGQDAEYAAKTSQSKYTKIDPNGNILDATATAWSCVKDNLTGLWWEAKKDSTVSDLQNQDNLYTWYNPNPNNNGGSVGVQNGGSCTGSLCDTLAYTGAVNAINLCGKSDWRLPTLQELLSLVNNDTYSATTKSYVIPAINLDYFPNTPAFDYWTSTPRAIGSNDSWSVYFYYGSISYGSNKNNKYRVRLVRDGQ